MKRHLSLSVVVLAGATLCLGAGPLSDAKQMRQERSIDRDHYELTYRFEPDAEHVADAPQVAIAGAEQLGALAGVAQRNGQLHNKIGYPAGPPLGNCRPSRKVQLRFRPTWRKIGCSLPRGAYNPPE